jgi:hypothetical protein
MEDITEPTNPDVAITESRKLVCRKVIILRV